MRKKLLQLLIAVLLLVFIRYVGFFMFGILPLSFNLLTLKTEYNINHKKLKLSESYNKLIKVPKEELVERLKGKANEVLLLEKGIYIIFNDKADITYEEFVEMNNIFKPLLGLI